MFKSKTPLGVVKKNNRFRKRVSKIVGRVFNNPGLRKDFQDASTQIIQGAIASTLVKTIFAEAFNPCECVKEQKRLKSIPQLRGQYEF